MRASTPFQTRFDRFQLSGQEILGVSGCSLTFHPDDEGNASLIMPDLPKRVPAKALCVTIQAEGGSTTPTAPIVMVGT